MSQWQTYALVGMTNVLKVFGKFLVSNFKISSRALPPEPTHKPSGLGMIKVHALAYTAPGPGMA